MEKNKDLMKISNVKSKELIFKIVSSWFNFRSVVAIVPYFLNFRSFLLAIESSDMVIWDGESLSQISDKSCAHRDIFVGSFTLSNVFVYSVYNVIYQNTLK